MDGKTFEAFVESRIEHIRQILIVKGREYVPGSAETSRFHNFELGAALNDSSIEETLWGFVTKHIVSVSDMVKVPSTNHSLAAWNEKLGDIVVYMLLLHGMVQEAHDETSVTKQALKAYHDHVNDLAGNPGEDEDDISKESPLTKAFTEADFAYEKEVAEAAGPNIGMEPPRNRFAKVQTARENPPVYLHTQEGGRPPEGPSMAYVGTDRRAEPSVKGESQKVEDSQDAEKEAAGDVMPNIVRVENIFISGGTPAEEHAKWLAAVTPPRDRNTLPRRI